MTYATNETSTSSANPVFLYTFSKGLTINRFNSGDQDLVYGGNTYTASSIRHQGINTSGEMERTSMDILFAKSDTFASTYFSPDYSDVITLTILRTHYDVSDAQVMWKGRVISYEAMYDEIKIACESIQTTTRRAGLRGKYQRTCRHALYSNQCGVDIDLVKVAATVDSISGLEVTLAYATADETPDGWFRGGILIKGTEYGYIKRDASNVVRLQYAVPTLTAGDSVFVAPGCNLSIAQCNNKFNNTVNFGGFPYISADNPFGGNAGVRID